jgi:uncharacterized protein YbjT (DUF2867 family)
MKILLTGATGYIAQRLLPVLLNEGHIVFCAVRDKARFNSAKFNTEFLHVIEIDFLKKETLSNIPKDIDAAYYLIHSMSSLTADFEKLEELSAQNFKSAIEKTNAKQIIYLSGIVNEEKLSKHLSSRKNVEEILRSSSIKLTTLRAGIIIGSGSASFEIIRDLVEKLPIMIAPKWLLTKTQPISIRNVIEYLNGVLLKDFTFDNSYDIGGPEILNYKQMLLDFADVRCLKRKIYTVPVLSPKLSSYWLYFITATSYKLAQNLVNSMKIEVVCRPNNLKELLHINLISYKESIRLAFDKIDHQLVQSSWIDALSTDVLKNGVLNSIEVPTHGCFKDERKIIVKNSDLCLKKIWAIGGETGWYYANFLWKIRGFIDKLEGGVGLRRGRKNMYDIVAGESLDFWRVLYANKDEKRLLLYAEMKLPGEAWLEFKIDDKNILTQTATFRPLGLKGRLYWYSVMPFHALIFRGMLNKLVEI